MRPDAADALKAHLATKLPAAPAFAIPKSDKTAKMLPADARAVVVLRFQEDLEPREIARVLDLPVNTVKSRLQRSLNTLRGRLAALKEYHHETD